MNSIFQHEKKNLIKFHFKTDAIKFYGFYNTI